MVGLVLTGALYSVFAPAQAADDTTESAAEAAGRQLYENSCITCHGSNLEGVPNRGPSLIGVGEASVYFQVHTGRMPLVRQEADAHSKPSIFSDEEIDQLMAYVQAHGGGPTVPSGDLRDGDLAQGGELFRLNCASCHNFVGEGGALSSGKARPSLRDASDLEIYTAMLTGPENMPVFGTTSSPRTRSARSSTTSRPSRRRPTPAVPASAASARSARVWSSGSSASAPCCSASSGWGARRDDARHPPGSTGGADVPGPLYGGPDDDYTPSSSRP
jgi:mono/diheme cytochrome c family protein